MKPQGHFDELARKPGHFNVIFTLHK